MSVTNARWIGTKENEKGRTVAYCTVCGGEEWTIGDIHHTPDCLVPLVTKQAGIIAGFTEQVGELKAALAASEQRVGEAGTLREILEEIEPRMVTILHDQETPLYACRDCHRVGSDAAANVEHAAWCIVTMARAALAPAAQRAPASAGPGDAKAGE